MSSDQNSTPSFVSTGNNFGAIVILTVVAGVLSAVMYTSSRQVKNADAEIYRVSMRKQQAENITRELVYFKHEKVGKCFALYGPNGSITHVPCEGIPKERLHIVKEDKQKTGIP